MSEIFQNMSDIFFAPPNPHAAALPAFVKILYHDC